MKSFLKKIIPTFLISWYHFTLASVGAFLYGHPSRKLIVIGVTGTKGKSTVVNLIAKILEGAGYKVGLTSTIGFKIADREWVNDTKQTMQGRWRLQQLLSQMVKAGCRYAVIETSSEGIAQYRHIGLDYDLAVFTNLSPEHIESHGGFENYKLAKAKLFSGLQSSFHKTIDGRPVKKVIIANADDKLAEYFLQWPSDEKITISLGSGRSDLSATSISTTDHGASFSVNNESVQLRLLGEFNISNALLAMAVGQSQGIEFSVMKKTLENVSSLPGRMEEIKNNRGFRVFVDYAHEPASLEAVYKTVKSFQPNRIIAVLGSQGGGRDKAKRPVLGKLAGQYADYVIVTNEDPYDENPQQIIDDVAGGSQQAVEKILDRKEAIQRALSLAQSGDIVIITGKGSETVMAVGGGKKIPWDDRVVARSILDS
jgi:UDP-N-acetylmuramoyl-L-alanyl-D-glutamate--2,6-diaminopimelate ligase